jgi:hypothetical protein
MIIFIQASVAGQSNGGNVGGDRTRPTGARASVKTVCYQRPPLRAEGPRSFKGLQGEPRWSPGSLARRAMRGPSD